MRQTPNGMCHISQIYTQHSGSHNKIQSGTKGGLAPRLKKKKTGNYLVKNHKDSLNRYCTGKL